MRRWAWLCVALAVAFWPIQAAGQVLHSYAVRCATTGTVGASVAPGRTKLIIRNDDASATILLYGTGAGTLHALTASDNSSQVGMFALHAMANSGSHATVQIEFDGPAAKIGFNCVSTEINSGILRWIEFFTPGR